MRPQPQPPPFVEFVIADTCRISGRGTAAMPEGDPRPWWPICWHRVRVSPPEGHAFEAEAGVNLALRQEGVETMVLLFRDLEPQDLLPGSRVISLATAPYEVKMVHPRAHDVKPPLPLRRWRQFWK